MNDSIRISFTGDIMIEHSRLIDYVDKNSYNFRPLFSSCEELFKKSDYVVANLETPTAGKTLNYSFRDYSFNTPEEILTSIKDCGIKMVTTANNHALDRGIEGLVRTINNIDSVGLDHTGTFIDQTSNKPLIIEIKGFNVAICSYTYGTEACYNGYYLKKSNRYMVNLLRNQELSRLWQRFLIKSTTFPGRCCRFIGRKLYPDYFNKKVEDYSQCEKWQLQHLKNDLEFCQNNSDYVIVCLHSGGQFNDYPTAYTNRVAQLCIENGADAVITNHEHLIQKCVADKKNFVAYCLGNFTSNYGIDRAPYDKNAQCSVLLHINLSKNKNEIIPSLSFSIMISERENGIIVTKPIYDAYQKAMDKGYYYRLATDAIRRFIGYIPKEKVEIKEEYTLADFELE